MKAIIRTKYGSWDVLHMGEAEKPVPGDDSVLVKVYAASINAMDWHLLRGKPLLTRAMIGGFKRPKKQILGSDIAGRVEAVGKDVTQFQPGDDVFGGAGEGGFAEYVCVRAKGLSTKPANVSFEEAAAVPVAAVTALQALRDYGHVKSGQKVLINGASGGVGTFAVQLAKLFGAEVTAVCSTRNLEMARRIGADHVIDYSREDFTKNGKQYDLIIDIAANHSVADYKRALSSGGVCVATGFSTLYHMLRSSVAGWWATKTGTKKFVRFLAKLRQSDIALLKELLEEGKIVPVLDVEYPIEKTAEAMRYFGEEHARGKVIISMGPEVIH